MASERYRELRSAARRIRLALLPRKFDATGSYRGAARVHMRAISYRLLMHAEIETYLEDRASELMNVGWSQWDEAHVPNRVVLALLAYGGIKTTRPPEKLGGSPDNQKAYENLDVPIRKAQGVWRAVHKGNHGVKEANVLALFLPLGVGAEDLGTTLLADLSSFGVARGEVAHRSTGGVTKFADPREENSRAIQLVADLEPLDQLVSEAMDEVRMVGKALRTGVGGGTAA